MKCLAAKSVAALRVPGRLLILKAYLRRCLRRAALPRSRRRPTWASASRSLAGSACRGSSSAGAASTTGLTSTAGWMTISTEGGPERSIHGP